MARSGGATGVARGARPSDWLRSAATGEATRPGRSWRTRMAVLVVVMAASPFG